MKSLQSNYGKKSISILGKRKKLTQKLEKKDSNTYSIATLWRYNSDLGLISNIDILELLAEDSNLGINNIITLI